MSCSRWITTYVFLDINWKKEKFNKLNPTSHDYCMLKHERHLPVCFIQYATDFFFEMPVNSQPLKIVNHWETSIYIERIYRWNWEKTIQLSTVSLKSRKPHTSYDGGTCASKLFYYRAEVLKTVSVLKVCKSNCCGGWWVKQGTIFPLVLHDPIKIQWLFKTFWNVSQVGFLSLWVTSWGSNNVNGVKIVQLG